MAPLRTVWAVCPFKRRLAAHSRKPPKSTTRVQQLSRHRSANELVRNISEKLVIRRSFPLSAPMRLPQRSGGDSEATRRIHSPGNASDLRRNPKILRCACDQNCVAVAVFFVQRSRDGMKSSLRLAHETNHLAQRAPERGSLRRAAVDYYLNFSSLVPHLRTATSAAADLRLWRCSAVVSHPSSAQTL